MTVTIYRSSDGSAPVLDGQVGSLITVLDACLVNGYGSKAAAGWTKPYTGTNAADYRMGAGPQHYFHVNDNSPDGTALGREAQIRGFEAMTAFNTGTNAFPTTGQLANGIVVRKSLAADGTARAWLIAADSRTVHIFTVSGDLTSTFGMSFGEYYSLTVPDNYNTGIYGRSNTNAGTASSADLDQMQADYAFSGGRFLARSYTQTGASIQSVLKTDSSKAGATGKLGASTVGLSYPNGPDGGLYLNRIDVAEVTGRHWRGYLRGLWGSPHSFASFANGDTITGATGTDLAGRSFVVVKTSPGTGYWVLETSDTWDTN